MNSTLFRKNKRWLILFAAPAVVLFCVIMVIPLFQTFYYSFFKWNGIRTGDFLGLANYGKLFASREINTSLINSIVYAFFWWFIRWGWERCLRSSLLSRR